MADQSPSIDNILQIKQENGEYAYVCSDNWSEQHADSVCSGFGYAHSRKYAFVRIGEQHNALVRINIEISADETVFANFHATNACDSNAIVQLVCEQYGKTKFKSILIQILITYFVQTECHFLCNAIN